MAEQEQQTRWTPDPAWALPVVITAWLWAAGWLPVWAAREGDGFPAWWMAAAGVLVGVAGCWRATDRWTEREYGPGMAHHGYALSVAAGVATGWWLVRAGYTTPLTQMPLLLLLAGLGGLWWWQLRTIAPKRYAEAWQRELERGRSDEHADHRALLDAAWCADVAILERTDTRAGYTLLLGPEVLDEDGQPRLELPGYDDFMQRIGRLRTHLAAYWRTRGVVLEERDVRPEPVAIDRWYVHVSTKHVEEQEVPASLAPAPRSWNLPVWLGLFLDGPDMEVTLAGRHMKVIGATGGGKSVIVNNVVRGAVSAVAPDGRRDALVWVCATNKLVPLVWPWLEPWFSGHTQHPVLDGVFGESPAEVRRFLAAVYYLARDRNRRLDAESKWKASPSLPGILVVLEEGKVATSDTGIIEMEDGSEWTISRLLSEICSVARSACISVLMVTQEGLFEGLGAWGDSMQRNITVRACTVTETESDGYNNLPKLQGMGVDTTMLRDNTMYLQVGLGEASRAMPGKAAHLDGSALITAAAVAASAVAPPLLEPEGVTAFGPALYNNRWSQDRQPELARAVQRRGMRWPAPPPATPWRDGPVTASAAAAAPTMTANTERPERPEPERVTALPVPGAHDQVPTPDEWRPEWDSQLAALLGGQQQEAGVVMDTGAYGLPGPESMDELDRLAAQMQAEADAADAPPEAFAAEGLPEPLGSVLGAVGALVADRGAQWVATAEVAGLVWGDDGPEAARKLGRAISAMVPWLKTTHPRPWGTQGKRGNGYVVAELVAAFTEYRDGRRA